MQRSQSPFNISKIPEMLSEQLSPSLTTPASTEKVNFYLRHSSESDSSVVQTVSNREAPSKDACLEKLILTEDFEKPSKEQSLDLVSGTDIHLVDFPSSEAVYKRTEEPQFLKSVGEGCGTEHTKFEFESLCLTESSSLTTETTTASFSSDVDDEESRFG